MTAHTFVNSDPTQFDSDCAVCGGKDRDNVHHGGKTPTVKTKRYWFAIFKDGHWVTFSTASLSERPPYQYIGAFKTRGEAIAHIKARNA